MPTRARHVYQCSDKVQDTSWMLQIEDISVEIFQNRLQGAIVGIEGVPFIPHDHLVVGTMQVGRNKK